MLLQCVGEFEFFIINRFPYPSTSSTTSVCADSPILFILINREIPGTSSGVTKLFSALEPQSRLGDKPVKFQVVCAQNGATVLKGSTQRYYSGTWLCMHY